jgi:SAM-dependent methyltransferase
MTNWLDYYDRAWAKRGEFMEQSLKEGCSLAETFAFFDYHERHHRLEMENATGEMRYTPVAPPTVPHYFKLDTTSLLLDMATGHDAVVEFGCGYGRRLLDLHLAGCDTPMVGVDPSRAGVALAQRLAKPLDEDSMRFIVGGFDTEFVGNMRHLNRTLVFTHYATMYQDPFPEEFFKNINQWGQRVTLLFIEPLTGWNESFLTVLRKCRPSALVWQLPAGDASVIFAKDPKDD